MHVSTAELDRVLDATRRLLLLQPASDVTQAVVDSAVMVFDVPGAALFVVDDASTTAVLTAASGSCATLPVGTSHEVTALLNREATPTGVVVPLEVDKDLVAVLWLRADGSALPTSEGVTGRLFTTSAAVALANARDYQRTLDADTRRQDDIATLAHELRNPLGAIVSALHALDRLGSQDAGIVKLRELIGRQAKHLTRLVEDVLDVARLRHGKLRLKSERFDVRDVVRVVVDTLRTSGRAAHHDLRADLGADALVVDGDVTRIEQVVRNLVDNALKYSPQETTIAVTTRAEGPMAVLRVRDQGIGMSAEMLARLFEPFAQAEAAGARRGGGLGLGLPLVKAIVEEHDGTIAAHSDGQGKGSELVVRLPIADRAPGA